MKNTMTGSVKTDKFRKQVLDWYDINRRTLPWRALPKHEPEPYHVWLSEVMLQQTVVNAVIPYFLRFVERWPTIHDLANAQQEDIMNVWAGLGYYSRARNLHKCAQIISKERAGRFPQDIKELKKLPGIGDYTASAITAIAFDKPATVIDGNIERVTARHFAIKKPLPAGKKEIRRHCDTLCQNRTDRPGDFAQALMDIGAGICIAKKPRCTLCPLHESCQSRELDIAETLPARAPKKAKPQKYGFVYWITDEKGDILCERRPEQGMLAGTLGLPTSSWELNKRECVPPTFITKPDNQCKKNSVPLIHHSFTHFDLTLEPIAIHLNNPTKTLPSSYFWEERPQEKKEQFPTVFKKIVTIML